MTDPITLGSPLVIDTSVLVDLLVGPDGAALADALVAHSWHAPAHLDIEVTSALRGLVLGGHLSPARAVDALQDLDDLGITRWAPDLPTSRRVLALRDRCTAYDAGFVVCAEGLGGALVTRDRRLANAVADLVEVVTL